MRIEKNHEFIFRKKDGFLRVVTRRNDEESTLEFLMFCFSLTRDTNYKQLSFARSLVGSAIPLRTPHKNHL